jgi:hypothetical protein
MNYKKIAIISLFSLVLVVSGPLSALAGGVSVETNEKNYAPAIDGWTEYGRAEVLGNDLVKVAQTKNSNGHLYTDVNIPNNDDYVLFVAYARAENPNTKNISGLPYLYAYFLDDDGQVDEYFAQTSMRLNSVDGQYWHVIYGIAEVPNSSESMRLFLKQAETSVITPDGRAAWFYMPGLYFVDSQHEAEDIIDAYNDELSNVKNIFGVSDYHSSANRDHNEDYDHTPDYSVGTLLKCSGEPEVYSMTANNTLKLFPNEQTFYDWGNSFADVKTISCSKLDDYEVSGIWSDDREDYLIKFHDQPAVYALSNDIYLRLIPDEYTAKKMYGSHWTSLIREYPISDMGNYSYGVPYQSLK